MSVSISFTPSNSTFVEGGAAAAVDGGVFLVSGDQTTVNQVTVAIGGGPKAGDVLAATATSGVSVAYNATIGRLTLSATGAPVALSEMEAVLRSMTYSSTSDNPTDGGSRSQLAFYYSIDSGPSFYREINVTGVNDAPFANSQTINLFEDTPYTLGVPAFGFYDVDGNSLLAVTFDTLPSAGVIALNGVAVTAGQSVSAVDIAAGKLVYTPPANHSGLSGFYYYVQDDGGTANGGADTSAAMGNMMLNVLSVNDAPSGADKTVTLLEDAAHVFAQNDFGFSDTDGGVLLGVKITTLPGAGALTLDGVAVTAGQSVTASDIAAGKLVFTSAANGNGTGYASLTFQVRDNGGTTNGGVDTDQTPNTIAFDVTPVNDPPRGVNSGLSFREDTTWRFDLNSFDISDPENNDLLAVKIATLPGAGTLALDGVAVTAGQFISRADIVAGKLSFTPAANANGATYATFTFQIQDDGGTANGGVDLDPTPRPMFIDVLSVNDAPSASSSTFAILEDTPRILLASDFGFSDAVDGDALAAVKIVTLPPAGSLALNGVAVTAGQFVSASDIAAGKLVFTPAANASGVAYAGFVFQVQDDGGTLYGGVDLSPAQTLAFDVTAVNDAPSGADKTVTTLEDQPYAFAASDFGFSDVDGDALSAVKIATLPGAGTLTLSGAPVTAGQSVAAADIAAGKLIFWPAINGNGAGYASFTFQVRDDGGTANGGVDTDPTARTITVDVTAVNDPPLGADKTIAALEDTAYVFAAGDFGFTDVDGDALLAVKIAGPPAAGSLMLDGVAVIADQFVSAADIAAGKLIFMPAANASGAGYATFGFQVQDDGGTANGGEDLHASMRIITVNVAAVNDAPSGASKTVTVAEDAPFAFAASDFGFSDTDGGGLLAVKVATLPTAGSLRLNGVAVSAGQAVAAADIAAGKLTFTPAANANGAGYASFTFQVQDNGGTANGGVDTDPTPRTITVDVTAVNDAPGGADKTLTVLENGQGVLAAADFGFADVDGHTLAAVKITTLPGVGALTLSGAAVTAGQVVSAADIAAGKLVFAPAADASGAGYASFTFQVQDDGGTASGGVDLDPTPNTLTFDVTAVNHAPSGADKTVTTLEDAAYVLAASDFGFADTDGHTLAAVKITTLPGAGALTLNGAAVTAGQSVAAADIAGGLLAFTPAADANGAGYASLTFQVQDNGGTADGGVDLDPAANTLTFDVTPVNDAPSGTDGSASLAANAAKVFALADFGFSDVDGGAFAAVRIATLPASGALRNDGTAVGAGQTISAADIAAGKLIYTAGAAGGTATLAFQVQDSGGTANGGVDLDQTANSFTFMVAAPPPPPPPPPGPPPVGTPTAPVIASPLAAFTELARSANLSPAQAEALAALGEQTVADRAFIQAVMPILQSTTSVAVATYQFFVGLTPTNEGLDYLLSSPANPNNLNSSYYAAFNLENRFMNFAVNLGVIGAGAERFAETYGGLSLHDTIVKAYGQIVGLDFYGAAAGMAYIEGQLPYFQAVAQERAAGFDQGLATRATVIGFILEAAVVADVGTYARAMENLYMDLADGAANNGVDLIQAYGAGTGFDLI